MARYLNQWTWAVFDAIADGAWHGKDSVVDRACFSVPPGRGFRAFVGDRAEEAQGWDSKRRDRAYSSGARMLVLGSVRGLVRSGTLEQRGAGRAAEIRLTPGRTPPLRDDDDR